METFADTFLPTYSLGFWTRFECLMSHMFHAHSNLYSCETTKLSFAICQNWNVDSQQNTFWQLFLSLVNKRQTREQTTMISKSDSWLAKTWVSVAGKRVLLRDQDWYFSFGTIQNWVSLPRMSTDMSVHEACEMPGTQTVFRNPKSRSVPNCCRKMSRIRQEFAKIQRFSKTVIMEPLLQEQLAEENASSAYSYISTHGYQVIGFVSGHLHQKNIALPNIDPNSIKITG